MYSINTLVKSIFAINMMKYISYATFSRYNYRLFIKLIIVHSFYLLRPHKEWIQTTRRSLITI